MASRMASSSSLNGMTATTGPKTSSRAIRIRLSTWPKTVGSMNRPSVQAGIARTVPAGEQLGTFVGGDLDVALHLLQLRIEGDRAHLGVVGERIAQPDARGALDQGRGELVVNVLVHQHA